jgi:hypothetical protein
MKYSIQNRTDLRREMARLTEERNIKEKMMKANFKGFADQLRPVNLVKSFFRSVTGDQDLKNQVTARGVEATLGFIISNLVFKNASPLIRTAASVLGSTAALKFFGDDSGKYIEKIRSLYDKLKNISSGKNETNDIFSEEDIYKQ